MTIPTFGAPDDLDRELGGHDDGPEPSMLEELAAELSGAVERVDPLTLPIVTRPGYRVTYQADDADGHDVQRMAARSTVKTNLDPVKFNTLLLAKTCTGIERQGKALTGENGRPLTFASAEFRQLMGTETISEAVRKFYGRDAIIVSHGEAVAERGGWGEDAAEDPTE